MAAMGDRGDRSGSAWVRLRGWALAERHRVFLIAAVALVVLCLVLLLLPDSVVSIGLAFLAAGLAAALALLSVGTWWAERRGLTDGSDLWDDDSAADRPGQVLRGFRAFGDDQGR